MILHTWHHVFLFLYTLLLFINMILQWTIELVKHTIRIEDNLLKYEFLLTRKYEKTYSLQKLIIFCLSFHYLLSNFLSHKLLDENLSKMTNHYLPNDWYSRHLMWSSHLLDILTNSLIFFISVINQIWWQNLWLLPKNGIFWLIKHS